MNTLNYLLQLKAKENSKIGLEEKFLFSRLNSTIKETTKLFEDFRFDETITCLEKFYLDLSRVYIKMTRDKSSEEPGIVLHALKDSYITLIKMFSTICPLLSEYIWQEMRKAGLVKEESVHLSEWPKCDEKEIDTRLEKDFDNVLRAIEAGLFARDKAQIGLKWPLAKARVYSNEKIGKEYLDILGKQLNVKKVEVVPIKELDIKVELDVKMTPELEAEGYAREISRKVQALRKEKCLIKENLIELVIFISDEKLKNLLESQKPMIADRTNSKKIEITSKKSSKKYEAELIDKIKDKEVAIYFNKV